MKLCDNLERMKIVTHKECQPEKPVAGIKLEQDDSIANAKGNKNERGWRGRQGPIEDRALKA